MTAIRSAPSSFAHVPSQGSQRPGIDPEKLAAQRAIFAQLTQAAPTGSPVAAAPARAAEPAIVQQAAPAVRRPIEGGAQPTKYMRPGSLLDIRV